MHAQIALQHTVVRTRDKLALGAALYARCRQQARAKANIGTTVQNGADKLGNLANIGGEVDIHIGAHAGFGRAPYNFEGAAAALLGNADGAERKGKLAGEDAGELPGLVAAGVVGDDDLPGKRLGMERDLAQLVHEQHDRGAELGLLVKDGDDKVAVDLARLAAGEDGRRGGLALDCLRRCRWGLLSGGFGRGAVLCGGGRGEGALLDDVRLGHDRAFLCERVSG